MRDNDNRRHEGGVVNNVKYNAGAKGICGKQENEQRRVDEREDLHRHRDIPKYGYQPTFCVLG